MSASAENSYKVEEFSITPLIGGLQNISLAQNSLASFEYYEDVLSPTVTAKATFVVVDVKNLPKGFEIYGGEKFNILISADASTQSLNLNDSIKNLYVRSVSVDKKSTSAIYSVELVSKETLTNETARIVNRFDGKVSDSASFILSALKTQKTTKLESSANKYSFIGNTRRPFDLLMWLCPKAVPTGTKGFGTAGYLFFENQDGYVFQSVDKLITQEAKVVYEQTEGVKEFSKKSKFRILASNVSKNNDILMSLRMGMYSNNSLFYDLYTNKVSTIKYTLGAKNIARSSNNTNYPKLPEGIEKYPSRYLVRTLDVGNLTDKPESIENLPKYQSEAAVRYNLLFSQILNITIPCNLDLRAGQVIECRIPESTADSKQKTFDSQQSGNYMIANLCHKFTGNQSYTFLSLIRDSYELKAGV